MCRLRIQVEGSLPWDPALAFEAIDELFPKEDISDFEEKNKELINKIRDTHNLISRPVSIATQTMWIGKMLLKQKEKLSHGEFLNFIERNFSFSKRTAQHYMKAYTNRKISNE